MEAESHPADRSHPAWEPEWIHGTFSAPGECENPNCRQSVQVVGDYKVDYSRKSFRADDPYEERGPSYSSFYSVAQIHPPLLLMPIPRAAPDEVRDGVLRASRVLFADAGLAATALRTIVERFMTSEGIASTTSRGGFRSARERVEEWRKADSKRDAVAALFDAIRWLGNAGTHEDADVTMDEVLFGASCLDEAFHRLYTGPNIDAQAQSINAARGPNRSG